MANINLSKLDFTGGITASIADVFKSSIRTYVEKELKDVACSELGTRGSGVVTDALGNLTAILDPYIEHDVIPTPLSSEQALDSTVVPVS